MVRGPQDWHEIQSLWWEGELKAGLTWNSSKVLTRQVSIAQGSFVVYFYLTPFLLSLLRNPLLLQRPVQVLSTLGRPVWYSSSYLLCPYSLCLIFATPFPIIISSNTSWAWPLGRLEYKYLLTAWIQGCRNRGKNSLC